ncbi:unnamed protein product [Bursaphelenchus okinawaensis]|uniref:Gluconokinase n=1 Tax=Bursaphelenchus okinawaensis TaxID=465554 RepID=A0A811LDX5_9BILA|nr:unnamed protein product [Bursaphelenchus okinawaensis]CAG9121439.1 unnamed protein product [Bursaphelenchus okinawaensis]
MTLPDCIIIGGVSGCGKTTVGKALAEKLNYTFIDGDDYHSHENKVKMSQGIGLNDDDRAPWLEKLAHIAGSTPRTILGCSCLKKKYRDLFKKYNKHLMIIILDVTAEHLVSRTAKRVGHYAKPNLLHSQFSDLEMPEGEDVYVVDGMMTPDEIAHKIIEILEK